MPISDQGTPEARPPGITQGHLGIEFAGTDLSAPVASAVKPQPILAGRPCGDQGLTVLNRTELVMSLTATAMKRLSLRP